MDMEKPLPEHTWLQEWVGEWTYEHECVMGPGQPPMKSSGTETVRALGPFWVLCEGNGDMPDGSPMQMIITIGYDPSNGKYVGSFVGSTMSRLWIYEGERVGNKLSLLSPGPSWADPSKIVDYVDATEVVSKDHRIFTSSVKQDDGTWFTFMTAHYRRKK